MEPLRAGRVVIPAEELEIRFSRSSGPGGQNVNRRDTRAEVTFDLLGSPSVPPALRSRAAERLGSRLDARGRIRVTASAARTQARNRDAALERLAELLSAAFAPPAPPRKRTKPTRAATEKRIAQKKRRSDVKRARRRADVERE